MTILLGFLFYTLSVSVESIGECVWTLNSNPHQVWEGLALYCLHKALCSILTLSTLT